MIRANEEVQVSDSQAYVLAVLRGAGARGVTTRQLMTKCGSTEAPRRARELRAAGYPITAFRSNGRWRYALVPTITTRRGVS